MNEVGRRWASFQKNPNKFGYSFDLHYLCSDVRKEYRGIREHPSGISAENS